MADHQQWVDVQECISAYLDRSEQSIHKQFKCFHIAIDGMKTLGLDFFYTVKSLKLPVNANLTVNLPADYLNWCKVGVFNSGSEVIPLIYNSKLTFFADQLPTRKAQTEDSTLYNYYNLNSPIFYNYWTGFGIGNLYGVPSGSPFVGSFKIDNSAGIIVLSEDFYFPYLVLEYIASPKSDNGYYIPIQFKEALIAWITWQDIQSMPNTRRGTLGDKEQRRRNFYNERRLAIARYKPISLEDAYEWNLRNQRLVVKA
jgi:hypothetical protein